MGVAGMPMTSMNNAQAPPLSWRSAFQQTHVVGEIVTGELRVAKFNDKVRDVVATKDRERGIRVVFKKAVLSLTPQRNEPAGLHMPGHARRTSYQPILYGGKSGLAIHTTIRVSWDPAL